MKRWAVLPVLALGGALALTGCQSNSYSCKNGSCHVTVSGAGQSIEVSDVDLSITQIGGDGMTVSADGSPPTKAPVGKTVQVGQVRIRVTSVDGQKVKFDMN
ncbi:MULTISPECIES: hypothetical protein [unclassified Actinomadura]|uniref:hypothetical protein n=1 Tax=unclassified Actinomadura TaxID=2626254 RepID=UPI0011F01A2B|nr:hypothetical protein [Actinomadura sp. K4S16]